MLFQMFFCWLGIFADFWVSHTWIRTLYLVAYFGKCLIVFRKERQHGAASINTDMEVGNVRQTRCPQNRYR